MISYRIEAFPALTPVSFGEGRRLDSAPARLTTHTHVVRVPCNRHEGMRRVVMYRTRSAARRTSSTRVTTSSRGPRSRATRSRTTTRATCSSSRCLRGGGGGGGGGGGAAHGRGVVWWRGGEARVTHSSSRGRGVASWRRGVSVAWEGQAARRVEGPLPLAMTESLLASRCGVGV